MPNYTYLKFISDEHLFVTIDTLFQKYERAKREFTIDQFFDKNMIDPIKLLFDMKFLGQSEEEKIVAEINRKIDKTLNNAIGEFHEQLLGGIEGVKSYPVGYGYDVKTDDDSIYADIKNKHNTVKGSNLKDLYRELAGYIASSPNPKAKGCWVQIISPSSIYINWKIPSQNLNNPNIYKVSGDKFYEILTGRENAFAELCAIMPKAIDDFLATKQISIKAENNNIYPILKSSAEARGTDIIKELFNKNFPHYNGFPIK